jgi:hypothetical protein
MSESGPSTTAKSPVALSGRNRALGGLVLLAVILGSGTLALKLRSSPVPEAEAPDFLSFMGGEILCAVFMGAGAAVYGLALVTRCLTFRFDRPFLPS